MASIWHQWDVLNIKDKHHQEVLQIVQKFLENEQDPIFFLNKKTNNQRISCNDFLFD